MMTESDGQVRPSRRSRRAGRQTLPSQAQIRTTFDMA